MKRIDEKQTLGEIVTNLPQAGKIFQEFQIDYCCGGHRKLGEVLKEQSIDKERLYNAIEKEQSIHMDLDQMNASSLIDHIEKKHHSFLRNVLPKISLGINSILTAHGKNHEELFELHKLFHLLKIDLEQHLIKEEQWLFPLIKKYDETKDIQYQKAYQKIMAETKDEHETAGEILKKIRKTTKDYAPVDDGCNTYEDTYVKLRSLESDLFEHIHLENNILFQQ